MMGSEPSTRAWTTLETIPRLLQVSEDYVRKQPRAVSIFRRKGPNKNDEAKQSGTNPTKVLVLSGGKFFFLCKMFPT